MSDHDQNIPNDLPLVPPKKAWWKRWWAIALGVFVLLIVITSVAGGGSSDEESSTTAPTETGAPAETGAPETTEVPIDATPDGEIVEFGFGRGTSGYIQGMVVARTDSAAMIGEFATVSVNFLDASGGIVATEDQVEGFSWVGQELAFPVRFDDEAAVVVSMDPVMTFSDYGSSEPSKTPLPVLETTEIVDGKYDSFAVSFEFTNETDEELSLRVGIVCYDEAGKVIGGGTTYPDAPPNRTIRIDEDLRNIQTKPASCKAFLNYGF